LTTCPLDVVTDDIWQAIEFAGLYRKGLAPVAGGALDQARGFIVAAQFIFSEQDYWRAKLGLLDKE
jgi:hypothetical protein